MCVWYLRRRSPHEPLFFLSFSSHWLALKRKPTCQGAFLPPLGLGLKLTQPLCSRFITWIYNIQAFLSWKDLYYDSRGCEHQRLNLTRSYDREMLFGCLLLHTWMVSSQFAEKNRIVKHYSIYFSKSTIFNISSLWFIRRNFLFYFYMRRNLSARQHEILIRKKISVYHSHHSIYVYSNS